MVRIATLPLELREQAVALWRDVGLTRPWNDPHDDLARASSGPGSTVLAAVEGNRVLGTVMVGHDGHRGWLYYLAVAPDVQRRGLGRALEEAAERWLRERGVPKVQLMVRAENADVVAFYRALGYEDARVTVLGRRLDG